MKGTAWEMEAEEEDEENNKRTHHNTGYNNACNSSTSQFLNRGAFSSSVIWVECISEGDI